jgi:hypothetical protein
MSPSQIHMQLQVDTKCTLFQSSSFPHNANGKQMKKANLLHYTNGRQ